MAIKLLGPVSFTQVLSLASEESLIQALQSLAPSANILAMTVLEKAARSPGDAAILSTMADLLAAFLRRWLAAPQVEVGEKGGKVLGDLLDIDCELPPPSQEAQQQEPLPRVLRKAPGQGKMWRRLFHDRDVYNLIIALCSGKDAETAASAHQLSLAQGRLLRVLPRLAALNFPAVTKSDLSSSGRGLLPFAALQMVDRRDMLMHLSLVDFFEAFVSITRVTEYSSYKIETIRQLLREATEDDNVLKAALESLPDRTVPEEADALRSWLREIMPQQGTRVSGHWENGA